MTRITITFSTENAAFEDNGEQEIQRVMRRATDAIFHGGGKLMDTNGNTIGKVEVED